MTEKFWLVWRPEGGMPNVKHECKDVAIDEAQRIAACEDERVYVCECIGYSAPQRAPIVWTDVLDR